MNEMKHNDGGDCQDSAWKVFQIRWIVIEKTKTNQIAGVLQRKQWRRQKRRQSEMRNEVRESVGNVHL